MPDPAIVKVGERVTWMIRFDTRSLSPGPFRFRMRFRWRIYFENGIHPFGENPGIWQETTDTNDAGIIAPGHAQQPGDYKYGVLIGNADTGETLSDDDPMLIVW